MSSYKFAILDMTTIEELQKNTIDYIKGYTNAMPYHTGPLWDDSKEMATELIKLNELYFITVDSQNNMDTLNTYGHLQQRAYIGGYIKCSLINYIIEYIKKNNDNVYYIFTFTHNTTHKQLRNCDSITWVTRAKKDLSTRFEYLTHECLFKNSITIPYHNFTKNEDMTNLQSKDDISIPYYHFPKNEEIVNLLNKDYTYVEFIIRDWKSTLNLGNYLIKMIEYVNLQLISS